MLLTKPAAVFAQIMGAIFVLIGLGLFATSILWGTVVTLGSAWLFWQGGKASRVKLKSALSTDVQSQYVENFITAQGGKFTYRVLAYRTLTTEEMVPLVFAALNTGQVSEPAPGATATLITEIH
jgi:hypothetical protein